MKLLFLLCSIYLSCHISYSQQKPELPSDFFDNFNYILPGGFNYNDSAQLKAEIVKIAADIKKFLAVAENNYSIKEQASLYEFLAGAVYSNLVLGKYQEAIDALEKGKKLIPSLQYLPQGPWLPLAYAKACHSAPDDSSETFMSAFRSSFINELNQINEQLRNDLISQLNEAHNNGWYFRNRALMINIFDQAARNNNKLSYDAVSGANSGVLFLYTQLMIAKRYQRLIENTLNGISSYKVEQKQINIVMRDGTKLGAFLYRDTNATTKLPAVITMGPYLDNRVGLGAVKGNIFAANGYNYVYIDNRGRGRSEGAFMPYENDARDYYDIIDWVSKQPWCDGQVATTGGSYLGFAQWQAIRREFKHPALKAINPMVAVGFGVDFPRFSHQFSPYILRWANYVSGKGPGIRFSDLKFWNGKYYELYKNRIPFSKLDSVAGMPNPFFQKWIMHPDFDTYWSDILPDAEDFRAIDIPILSITGYFDGDQTGAMYYFNNHQKYGNANAKANHYLLIGPYNHGAAQWAPPPRQGMQPDLIEDEALIPIYKYVIWWFDWVLKGKMKPDFIKDQVTYYETGNHSWKGAKSFNQITTDSLELFLSPAITQNDKRKNLLSLNLKKPNRDATLKYQHDISMALDSSFLFATPKRYSDSLYMVSPFNLVFESEPLQKDILITDKIVTRLYMSLNVPDADFEVNIMEISPDGKNRNLAQGPERVRYRDGGEKPQLVKPGEIFLLNFDEAYIYIKKISRGSRLRLVFQSMNHYDNEKNFGFGGEVSKESTKEPRLIEATILMSNKYPSKLIVPYRPVQ